MIDVENTHCWCGSVFPPLKSSFTAAFANAFPIAAIEFVGSGYVCVSVQKEISNRHPHSAMQHCTVCTVLIPVQAILIALIPSHLLLWPK